MDKRLFRNRQKMNSSPKSCLCPICIDILIEPVVMPCGHELCHSCFRDNVEQTSLVCPMCRTRIGSWSRRMSKCNKLINQERWAEVQAKYPEKVKKRLEGIEDDTSSEEESITPVIYNLAKPGEIHEEYEREMKRLEEDQAAKAKEEEEASLLLIQQLQEQEEQLGVRWQKLQFEQQGLDAELATKIDEKLNKGVLNTPDINNFAHKWRKKHPPTMMDKFLQRGSQEDRENECLVDRDKGNNHQNQASMVIKGCDEVQTYGNIGNTVEAGDSKREIVDLNNSDDNAVMLCNSDSQIFHSDNPYPIPSNIDSDHVETNTSMNSTLYDLDCSVDESDSIISKDFNPEDSLSCTSSSAFEIESPKSAISSEHNLNLKSIMPLNFEETDFNTGVYDSNIIDDMSESKSVKSNTDSSKSGQYIDEVLSDSNTFAQIGASNSNANSGVVVLVQHAPDKLHNLHTTVNLREGECALTSPQQLVTSLDPYIQTEELSEDSISAQLSFQPKVDCHLENVEEENLSMPIVSLDESSSNACLGDMYEELMRKSKLTGKTIESDEVLSEVPSLVVVSPSHEELLAEIVVKDSECDFVNNEDVSVKVSMLNEVSNDSISVELVHFNPIQTCSRTPPKRLVGGGVHDPPMVWAKPQNVSQTHACKSVLSALVGPEPLKEGNPILRQRLLELQAERRSKVIGLSKGTETDEPLSRRVPLKQMSSTSNFSKKYLADTSDGEGSNDSDVNDSSLETSPQKTTTKAHLSGEKTDDRIFACSDYIPLSDNSPNRPGKVYRMKKNTKSIKYATKKKMRTVSESPEGELEKESIMGESSFTCNDRVFGTMLIHKTTKNKSMPSMLDSVKQPKPDDAGGDDGTKVKSSILSDKSCRNSHIVNNSGDGYAIKDVYHSENSRTLRKSGRHSINSDSRKLRAVKRSASETNHQSKCSLLDFFKNKDNILPSCKRTHVCDHDNHSEQYGKQKRTVTSIKTSCSNFTQCHLDTIRRERSSFKSQSDFSKYCTEQDSLLALKLQREFNMEEKYRLSAIRSKGSEGEYTFRQRRSASASCTQTS